MEKNMAEEKFLIENYGKKSTFASFLPGISGEKGIPIWCYYVNRGQCVVSFGVDNKDHSIMEFYPAHQAYQNVKTTGFRTFVKKDGKVTELFADENQTHRMEIAMNGLKIEEENDVLGVNAKVTYFTLPGEKIGALVRKVELTNTTGEHAKIEVLDGMPALIPYGVGIDSMKNMCQTSKAWMQVEDVKDIFNDETYDEDLKFENVIDENIVNDFDDIEFRINTYNEHAGSYSYVLTKIGDEYYFVDTLTDTASLDKLKAEEHCINKYVNYYSKPRFRYSNSIKNTHLLS